MERKKISEYELDNAEQRISALQSALYYLNKVYCSECENYVVRFCIECGEPIKVKEAYQFTINNIKVEEIFVNKSEYVVLIGKDSNGKTQTFPVTQSSISQQDWGNIFTAVFGNLF